MVAAFLILCYLTIRAEGITLKLEVTKSTLISFRQKRWRCPWDRRGSLGRSQPLA
jgi:hypothetical protein